MVSIHIVPVIVCLIIKVISSTFRFKRGADSVYPIEGCGKTLVKDKRNNTPHSNRYVVSGRRMRPFTYI